MITEITIKNFKSFECLSTRLGQITVLHGGNGTGKSNFLAVFELLRAVADRRLQNHVLVRGGAQAFLQNGDTSKKITITLASKKAAYQLSLGEKNKNLAIEEEKVRDGSSTTHWTILTQGEAESRHSHPFLRHIISHHFHDTGMMAGMRRSEIIQDNAYLRQDASNIAPFLLNLRRTRNGHYGQITSKIREILPGFEDFVLEPTQNGPAEKVSLTWKQKGTNHPMQPWHFSDGAIRLICLTTALMQPDPPIIMTIDEPELGLSSSAIKSLASTIKAAAVKTQIILATQSPNLPEHLSAANLLFTKEDNKTHCLHLKKENP